MATLREVKSRISAVQNIKKIAETMEKIATAKVKKNGDRLFSVRDYKLGLDKMLRKLLLFASGDPDYRDNPLLAHDKGAKSGSKLLLIVTSNRGLCGGYNQNILALAKKTYDEVSASGKAINYLIGKKGNTAFKYRKVPIDKSFLDIDDNVSFATMAELGDELISLYVKGEIDEVELIYTKFYNNAKQAPVVKRLLPFTFDADLDADKGEADKDGGYNNIYISEPGIKGVLDGLLPLSIRMGVFYMILEAVLSEQIARRSAMKQASDSASDIIKSLSLEYNRARQSKITKEIIEIIGAAKALKK